MLRIKPIPFVFDLIDNCDQFKVNHNSNCHLFQKLNDLTAFVSRKQAFKWFKLKPHQNNFICSILFSPIINYQFNNNSNIFINVKIENIQSHHEDNDLVLKLYVKEVFLKNYNLSIENNNFYIKQIINYYPISKLIIGIEDYNYYESIICKNWSDELKKLINSSDEVILARKNDCFLGDNQLRILECQPIQQGIITNKTQIIILHLPEIKKREIHSPSVCCVGRNDDLVRALRLINFTSKLTLSKFINQQKIEQQKNSTILETFATSTALLKAKFVSFRIIIMTEKPFNFEYDSENGCIFVSNNAMTNKIQCCSGEWVRISLLNDNNESQNRLARVFPVSCDDDLVYISPQLWLNLQQLTRTNRPLVEQNVNLIVRNNNVNSSDLKYMKAAHVSLIQSAQYSAKDDFSNILQKYFSKERFIIQGDIIGVPSKDDLLFCSQTHQFSSPIIYFRVSLVEGKGSLIDVNHDSKLYQAGTVHSFVPLTLQSYYDQSNFSIFNNLYPPGLERYVKLLCKLVYPYQNPNNKICGTILINGLSGCGKRSIIKGMCKYWNLQLYEMNSNDILGDTPGSTEAKLKIAMTKCSIYSPCVVMISNINLLCNNVNDDPRIVTAFVNSIKELQKLDEKWPIIIIATNSDYKKVLNHDLYNVFLHELNIDCPEIEEREVIIRNFFGKLNTSFNVNFKDLAKKTAGYNYSDLCALISSSTRNLYYELLKETDFDLVDDHQDFALAGVTISNEIIMKVLNQMQQSHADAIGAPKIPDIKWEDIGGLEDIKSEILSTIQLPYEHPQLVEAGLHRSGLLLYGPPGTGKTLLAKAVATQCSINFLSVKGPELINMYVGQSEENVREVFQRAKDASPCIIFFDELDSLAPNRGKSGDSGGVMDRVVSQLLAEMDGLDKSNDVFVIGATNRPDLLDPALLRPGRFDRLLYVGISQDSVSRLKILKALTRKFDLEHDVDLELIESQCPSDLTGADFYSLCSNAMMNAVGRCIKKIQNGEINEEQCQIKVQLNDFIENINKIVPTLSQADINNYKLK